MLYNRAMPKPQLALRVASICLCLCLAVPAHAQRADSHDLEIYNGCGIEGDARSPGVQALNRLKNRYVAPQQVDPAITLAAMLAPGRDTGRWKVKQGAETIGIEMTGCSGGIAEVRIDRDAPFLQQPFRYVDPIPVALAPVLQLVREGIHLRREPQLSDPHLEFGRENWRVQYGTTPVGISASSMRNRKSNWSRHSLRFYSVSWN